MSHLFNEVILKSINPFVLKYLFRRIHLSFIYSGGVMTLNLSDRTNYLNGLIVLFCKQLEIDNAYKKIIDKVADTLELNHYYVESAIKKIMECEYVISEPPEFSDKNIAEAFIKDAIHFAFADGVIHIYEFQWLFTIVLKNNLSEQWFLFEVEYLLKDKNNFYNHSFEIQKYVEKVLC
jgi:uncharacterized ubiquitin-like protein YukD